jgi:integrase
LDKAKDIALEQYMEHLFKHKHGIPSVSKRFADIARLSVAEMRRKLEAGEGKKIFVDYIAVTENYLIPFFGKFNIANIGYKQVHAYEQWRREKFGRELKASTVNTHNSALNRVFDEAVALGYMQKSQVPVLTNTGRASMRRADFTRNEFAQMLRALPHWVPQTRLSKSLQMRELLRDYIRFLANTGIRHGTEAQNVCWKHIDVFEDNGRKYLAVWVDGKTGQREVIARASTITYLKRIHKRCEDINQLTFDELLAKKLDLPVFRLGDGTVTNHLRQPFKKFMQDTGLLIDAKTGQERTLYCLRHTYATFQLVNNNVDMHTLAKQMGTSILMLEKHYSHLTPRLRKDVLTR